MTTLVGAAFFSFLDLSFSDSELDFPAAMAVMAKLLKSATHLKPFRKLLIVNIMEHNKFD